MVHFENTFVANPAVVGSGRLWGLTWSGGGHTEAVNRGHTHTHGHTHVLQYFHPFLKSSDVVSLLPLLFRVTYREGGGGGRDKTRRRKLERERLWGDLRGGAWVSVDSPEVVEADIYEEVVAIQDVEREDQRMLDLPQVRHDVNVEGPHHGGDANHHQTETELGGRVCACMRTKEIVTLFLRLYHSVEGRDLQDPRSKRLSRVARSTGRRTQRPTPCVVRQACG